jgi:TIR domain
VKPRVFLSHAKTDRELIERLAADLRAARIEVWFDEWEIPTGTSLRQRVFNGIARCDVFFVYLTEASRGSTWVERELDAAFVKDYETDGGSVALFVDSDATRRELPLDLRSLRVPVMSNEDYARPLADLVSRVWEVHERRLLREHDAKAEENTRIIERNFAHVANGLGRLIRMYNRPASFAWYEWHHRVTAVGDGAIRVRAGIRGDDPPRLWWRHTFGALIQV